MKETTYLIEIPPDILRRLMYLEYNQRISKMILKLSRDSILIEINEQPFLSIPTDPFRKIFQEKTKNAKK